MNVLQKNIFVSGFRRLLRLVLLCSDDRGGADLTADRWLHRHHPQTGSYAQSFQSDSFTLHSVL